MQSSLLVDVLDVHVRFSQMNQQLCNLQKQQKTRVKNRISPQCPVRTTTFGASVCSVMRSCQTGTTLTNSENVVTWFTGQDSVSLLRGCAVSFVNRRLNHLLAESRLLRRPNCTCEKSGMHCAHSGSPPIRAAIRMMAVMIRCGSARARGTAALPRRGC